MTSTFAERLERCDREIALAMAESHKPHTEAEHAGILVWEMDWRIERENVLAEMAAAIEVVKRTETLLRRARISSTCCLEVRSFGSIATALVFSGAMERRA